MGTGAISKLVGEDDYKNMQSTVAEELKKDKSAADLLTGEDAVNEVKKLRAFFNDTYCKIQLGIEREEELARRRKTGKVKVVYEQYDDMFDISDGALSVHAVDDEYCLSDIMPGCTLELIPCAPQEKIKQEIKGIMVPFNEKSEDGKNFINLYTYEDEARSYWILAYQDAKQREEDMKKTRERLAIEGTGKDSSRRVEGCSCIEGNPCTEANKYNCKNWKNRYEIAKKNGWKGF